MRIHEGVKESIQEKINEKLVSTKDKLTSLREKTWDGIIDVQHNLITKKVSYKNDSSALQETENMIADAQKQVKKSKG